MARCIVLVALFSSFVFSNLDQTFARHAFVVQPPVSKTEEGIRIRRESGNDTQSLKPEVKSLVIDSVIKFRYANTLVFSKLVNTANESRQIGFTAVLPDEAFISGFAITINGSVYKAYVKEKEEAKRIYDEAVESGRTAGHVELSARDSNTFTVSVNVEAFGKVAFNLTYEELLTRELGTYKHKISINPGQVVKNMLIEVKILESSNITSLHVPELRESNELTGGDDKENTRVTKEVNGATAVVRWSPTPEEQQEINNEGVKGLLEIHYDLDRTSHPNQILVNEGYFVHFFAPPISNPLHKHVVFVLDRSGSMYGRKIEQLKEAMTSILDSLRTGDSFSIVLFSDTILLWHSDGQVKDAETRGEPISNLAIASVTPENIQAAKNTVDGIDASGGTHIYDALKTALRVIQHGHNNPITQVEKKPMIIFLTDGQANGPNGDSETIINHTTRDNKNPSAVLYGLAFGSDADFGLLKKVSLKNSGFARKIYEASDASLQLKNFYQEVSSPLLSDVTFHYLDDQVDPSSLTQIDFRTLNNGSEIVVAGRLGNSTNNDLNANVTGVSVTGNISLQSYPMIQVTDFYPRAPIIQNASEAGFMERLWAYLTIRQLLDLKDQMDNNETVKDQALELALKYSFVTSLTSLVVVKPNDTDSAADLEATQIHSAAGDSPMSFSSLPYQPRYAAAHPMMAYGGNVQSRHFLASPGLDRGMLSPDFQVSRRRGSRRRNGGRTVTRLTTSSPAVQDEEDVPDLVPVNPHVGVIVPLSSYTWFTPLSNDTHITLLVNGVQETLQIGYNETDVAHSHCSHSLSGQSHCRHLPHCSLPNFSQDINVYLQYFCRIDSFIGVCCPDNVIT